MAKNDNFEIDFDDFDDDLNFDIGSAKPLTRIEKVGRFKAGMKTGIIDALKDPHVVADILSRAIPSEYGIDPKLAVTVGEDIAGLLKKARDEGGKVNNELKQAIADSSEDLKKFIPTKQYEKLKRYADSRERPNRGAARVSEEDEFVTQHLQGLFENQEGQETLREARASKREVKRLKIDLAKHGETIESLGAITHELQAHTAFNNNVTARYQRKSLEIGVRHLHIAAQTLLAIRENAQATQDNLASVFKAISKPEVIKLAEHETTRQQFGGRTGARSVFGGGLGVVDRLRTNAGKRLSEMISTGAQAASLAVGMNPMAMSGGMLSPSDLYQMGGAQAGGMAARFVGGLAAGKLRNVIANSERGKRFGGRSRYTTQNFRRILEEQYLENQRNEFRLDENGNQIKNRSAPFVSLLRDLIGEDRGSRSLDIDNANTLQEPHPFTRQTNRTINEVIPKLLSSIRGELIHLRTGENPGEVTFDFAEGRLVSTKTHGQKVVHEVLKQGDGDLVKDRTERLIDQVDPDRKLDPALRRKIGEQLLADNYNNRLASPERLGSASTFANLSKRDAKRVANLFGKHFEGDTNHERANAFSEGFNELLAGSNINRDQIQSLLNTGNREYLEAAGFVKDGMIDQHAIMRAMLGHDYGSIDSSLGRNIDQKRAEVAEEQARVAARAQGWSDKLKGFKNRVSDRVNQTLATEEGQSNGAAFAARAKALRAQAQAVYEEANLSQRVSDLSDEAVDFLAERGFDVSRDNLSAKARDALARAGLLERFDSTTQSIGRNTRNLRVRGRRRFRQAREAVQSRYDQTDFRAMATRAQEGVKNFDLQAAKASAIERLKQTRSKYEAEGLAGFVPASASAIQARVMEALRDVDPSEITDDLIERVTPLAVSAEGKLRSLDELRVEVFDAIRAQAAKQHERIQDRGGVRGIMDSLKSRFKGSAAALRSLGAEKLTTVAVEAEAIGGAVGDRFDTVGEAIRSSIGELKETLVDQYEETKARNSGPRVGSYEDLKNSRSAKAGPKVSETVKHDKKDSGFNFIKMLMGGFGALGKVLTGFGLGGAVKAVGMLGSLATGLFSASKFIFKAAGAVGSVLTRIPLISGGLAKLGGALGALGGGKLLAGAKTAGKFLLTGPSKATLWAGAKAIGSMGLGAAKLGLNAARMLPMLFNPVGAAVAGAAVVGYIGYKLLTRLKPTPLNTYRMIQYGIERGNTDKLRKIAEFEELVVKHVSFSGQTPTINWGKVAWDKVFKLFSVDPKEPEEMAMLEQWILNRFNPVFTVWAGVSNRVMQTLDFRKAEDLKGEELKTFVSGIKFTDFEYSTEGVDPIDKEPLYYGQRDVKGAFEELKTWADKKADEKGFVEKTKDVLREAGGFLAGGGIIGAGARALKRGAGALLDKLDPEGKIQSFANRAKDAVIGAGAAIVNAIVPESLMDALKSGYDRIKNFFVRAKNPDDVRRLGELKAFEAIRMRMYGLIDLGYNQVRLLLDMERYCHQDINYRNAKGVEYDGSVGDVGERFFSRFGILNASSEDASAWREWFNLRFLPVFVNACAIVRKLTNEPSFEDGVQKLNTGDSLEAAKFILGTVTQYNDETVPVWAVLSRAWPNLAMNSDPESVKPNLDYLEQEVARVKLREERAGSQAQSDQRNKAGEQSASGAGGSAGSGSGGSHGGGHGSDSHASSSPLGGGSASPYNPMSAHVGSGPGVAAGEGRGGKASEIHRPTGTGYPALKPMLDQVADIVGIDPKLLAGIVAIESSMDPSKVEPNTKAAGLGQAIPTTWEYLLKRYGARYGLGQNASALDPVANALMTAEYIKENIRSAKNAVGGRAVQPIDVYLSHFLGPGGFKKFMAAKPNELAADVRPAAAKSNPDIFYHDGRKRRQPRTVAEVIAFLNNRINARAQDFGVVGKNETLSNAMTPTGTPEPTGGVGGGSVNPDAVARTGPAARMDASPEAVEARLLAMTESTYGQTVNSPLGTSSTASVPNMDGVSGAAAPSDANDGVKVATNGMPIDPELSKVKGVAGQALLVRERSTESGTFGVITLPDGTKLNTLELPWKENKPRESCIPTGTYKCGVRQSRKFGTVYEVYGVPGRSAILFHAGNSAGDASKGLRADSQGCILLGLGRSTRGSQEIITESQSATRMFMERLGGREFTLTITGGGADSRIGAPEAVPKDRNGNPTMDTPTATQPFTDQNPMEQLGIPQMPQATGPVDASIPAPVDALPTVSYPQPDPYAAVSPQSAPSTQDTEILNRQLGIQSQMLEVLTSIRNGIEQIVKTGVGNKADMTGDERMRAEAEQRANAMEQTTRQRVNQRTDTPNPVIDYLRKI